MNKRWLFAALIAAMIVVGVVQRRQSAVSPAEEAAIARLDWLTDFDAARARSRAENKSLLIDFTGSDWCPPCMRLRKEVFSKPEFTDYAAKNLVLLEVDFQSAKPSRPRNTPPTTPSRRSSASRDFRPSS